MTDDDQESVAPDGGPLLNPYRAGAVVRGVTLGGAGLVAAGVLVVAVGPGGAAGVVGDGTVDPGTQVWIGAGPAVDEEISRHSVPSGYLWPAPSSPDPQVSPALW